MPTFMDNVLSYLETHLSTFLLSCVCRTIRVSEENTWFVRKRLFQNKKGAIFCLWHNRLFYLTYYISSRFYYSYPHVSVLASSSRDGRKIANVINRLGGKIIPGSTSRRSTQALRDAIREARNQQALFLTPDGPRGPRYEVQKGAAFIANSTGQPVVPITYGVSDFIQLNSWDRFVVPRPYAQGVVRFGEPIWPGGVGSGTDQLQSELQNAMDSLDQRLRDRGYHFE